MRLELGAARILVAGALAALVLLTCVPAKGQGTTVKLEAQLLWGTNDPTSPNPKHKPVSPELKEKLKNLPFKWKNYFEVNRKVFGLPQGASRNVTMSDLCEIEMKNLDGTRVEVSLYGKGKKVGTRTQPLPKGEVLLVGGNAPDSTSWFVAVRQVE